MNKGDTMSTFDNVISLQYTQEAKEKWGDTAAYKESTEKTKNYSKEKWSEITSAMDDIIAEFAECKRNCSAADSDVATTLVRKWQDFINANFYTCTNGILQGLAEIYVADERFKANIDRHGTGTAEFMRDAIINYCR